MRFSGGLARIGLFLAGGVPALISFFAGHVVTGLFLFVLGEVVAAGAALAVGVFNDLGVRWRNRITELLDQYILMWVSGAGKRYHGYVLGMLRKIEEQGPATRAFYRPDLDEVFVNVALVLKAPHRIQAGLLSEWKTGQYVEAAKRHSIHDFIDRPGPQVLAVLGAPGSGKTTLLRRTAQGISRDHRNRKRKRKTPILLYLRDQAAAIERDPRVDIATLLCDMLDQLKIDVPKGWFERRLRAGTCTILLDGLDEIGSTENRQAVSSWIDHQVLAYHRNDFIVTSRPQGYLSAPINNATVLTVQNFSYTQVEIFIHRWYQAIERQGEKPGDSVADFELLARSSANDLIERLSAAPALYDLTVNPLLLTMLVNVHRFHGALPGSRADLYKEICQVMLWRRQEAKKLKIDLRGDRKLVVLCHVAYHMMRNETRDLSRSDLLEQIEVAAHRFATDVSAEDFLADVGSNGLLVERESGYFAFAHQTFQEYLAATHIRNNNLAGTLANQVDSPWWRETVLLYALQFNADEIVEACLEKDTVATLSLAIECVDQDSDLHPVIRNRVEQFLKSISTEDVEPERWRLRAGVLVNRHLRDVLRTRGGSRVCAQPVTAEIYELFEQDTQHPRPDALNVASRTGSQLVTGVRGRDALAFAGWANTIFGNQTPYRLVSAEEIRDLAVQNTLRKCGGTFSVWTRGKDEPGEPELWVPPAEAHPHLISSELLAHTVAEDIKRCGPSLVRLLLLQALMEARLLARDLDYEFGRAHAYAQSRKQKTDIDHILANARQKVTERTMNYYESLSAGRSAAAKFGLQDALETVLKVLRAVAVSPAQTRKGALESASEITGEIIAGLEPNLANVFAVSGDLADHDTPDHVMGQALAKVFAQVMTNSALTPSWSSVFINYFVETMEIASSVIAAPDTLEQTVRDARSAVASLHDDFDDDDDDEEEVLAPSLWSQKAARAIERTAVPVFDREQPLTPDLATAIRLAALCLTAEKFPRKAAYIGPLFHKVAAGITLLEHRSTGRKTPTETILLAPA